MSSPERSQPLESGQDAVLESALNCYLESDRGHRRNHRKLIDEIGASCHDQLLRLRSRVAYHVTLQTLEESRVALHSELIDFSEKARQYNNALAAM